LLARRILAMSKTLSMIMTFGMMAIALSGVYGCGGSKGQNGNGGAEGDILIVQGKVSSRGSTPFSLLVLETTAGKLYLIEPSQVADELRALDGMEVSVRAKVLPQHQDEHPALDVIDYELLALPSGEVPIVGYIRPGGMIEDTNMVIWVIDGDFQDLLSSFVGSKVWIVGVPMQSVDRPEGTYRTILVTEYGVIRP
jgi:hypothetical protein